MEQNEQLKGKKIITIGKKQIEHWHIIAAVLILYDYVAVCACLIKYERRLFDFGYKR